jgi:uncharacterized protein DUF6519
MKGDFTRITFDAAHHFSRVLMQQGRVTLDADPNEQADILLHYLRTLARDLIGPFGGPAGSDLGFRLTLSDPTTKPRKLMISSGRYYVDGILVENDSGKDVSYDSQPDYMPVASDSLLADLARPPSSARTYWLYLDVWERHITPIEDGRVREVALGGPDTCTRSKVVWQVKSLVSDAEGPDACTAPLDGLTRPDIGQMAADLDPGQQIKDPCVIAPDARFRGAQNQLYRVEIHRAGSIPKPGGGAGIEAGAPSSVPTFKWSRDNGSVATAVLSITGKDLAVASARGFSAGNSVELSDDAHELRGEPGTLVKLVSVDGNTLRVDPGAVLPSDLKTPKVRRWDQTENDDITLTDGAIMLTDGDAHGWIDLEDGVRVKFNPGDYRTGDYWVIPARVATGNIEWPPPGSTDGFAPPRGIEHHFAPLARVSWSGSAWSIDSCLLTLTPPVGPEPARVTKAAAASTPSSTPPQPQPPQPQPSPSLPAPATTRQPSSPPPGATPQPAGSK